MQSKIEFTLDDNMEKKNRKNKDLYYKKKVKH